MHVLILWSGSHHVLAVTRSLVRHGAVVTLGAWAEVNCPAAVTQYCRGVLRTPAADSRDLIPFLLGWLERHPVDVVLPLSDIWLKPLACHAEPLGRLVALAMPPPEAVEWALDKARTTTVWPGAEHPLLPPATLAAAGAESAAAQWTHGFPAIVKPRTATGADGIRLVRNAAELATVWADVHRDFPLPLVQELIDYAPKNKFCLLYLFDAEGRLAVRYMHRVIEEVHKIQCPGGGRIQGGLSLVWESVFDDDLLARGQTLLERIGWRGFAEIECVRAESGGRPRLIEVNARLPGGIGLSLGQGVEFAVGACLVALGRQPVPQLDVQPGHLARQDWLTLLADRRWAPLLRAVPRRVVGANPPLAELALIRTEAWRLLRKRLPPRLRATHPAGTRPDPQSGHAGRGGGRTPQPLPDEIEPPSRARPFAQRSG